ncbi:PadR family transcriptional regulator [Paenibacillus dokdonensis]|uniref:PadR family transcriptional regulator n=1 Tax=Paenibacillus dokdonensis TaxID=2567944 RepID=A0ABU6GV11_9BACL|nr:PadR family transcriptional regulator [Paenibacillus dokdonensis]MEC0242186.1 PadR family transcriptional regulator [Paenibacillus dokdonensis]
MSLQIFILGVLSSGHHHPYDIKKMFKQNVLDDNSKINDGTLYYNFEVMLKKGYIEKIEVIRDDNRPEKTTYGITPFGKEHLQQEIYAIFKNFTRVDSLYSAVLFLKHVDPKKLEFLIEEAQEKLENKIKRDQAFWETVRDETPPAVHLIHDHASSQMKVDLQWLEKLKQLILEQQ